ncbi:MAG TPA: patatin-like phospholipase family protein, partial [Ilumatobacteraceae bacterium]
MNRTPSDDDNGVHDDVHDTIEVIARQSALLRAELRRAADIFVHGRPSTRASPGDSDDAGGIDLETLELTVAGWRHHLPADPVARRSLADVLVARFGAALRSAPRLRDALSIDLHDLPDAESGDDAPIDTSSLEYALERVDLPGGTTLFEQGDAADSLWVITRGRLRLLLPASDGGESLLRELGPDQTVGELALLTGDVRMGTVVAVRDSVLYRLGRDDFERCSLEHPNVAHTMLATLAARLAHPPVRGRHTTTPKNIAVVPAGTDAPPIREFAEALAAMMSQYVDTFVLTAPVAEDVVGQGAVAAEPSSALGVRLHEHLSSLEDRHQHVIYVADDVSSTWTRRCARDADLILLVGRAGANTELNALERELFEPVRTMSRARLHLVLVEPDARRTPSHTAPWLRQRDVELCHHVHLEWRSHFARLARFVVGSPVGLVLSGGAARAFAHIGVLRALRTAGIPIDVVAATSAGALVGGQFAMGWTPERIEQFNREIFGGPRRKLLDFVPPFTSLIGSTRFNTVLDEIFGSVRFEDLWIQFMCTTTDLTSARPQTHHRGRMRPYVRASCSLPMVMPPVIQDGHLIADGGIMNNVPVDPLLEVTNVGTLIVVNVTNPFYDANE